MPRFNNHWRIANTRARPYVESRREFKGSNLYGAWYRRDLIYVVYSYGPHFPLYIWRDGRWFGNDDACSRTTTKHKTQVMPWAPIEWRSTEAMKRLLQGGETGIFGEPLTGDQSCFR